MELDDIRAFIGLLGGVFDHWFLSNKCNFIDKNINSYQNLVRKVILKHVANLTAEQFAFHI